MAEYLLVEKPFLDQLAALGWMVIDPGVGVPADPARSRRARRMRTINVLSTTMLFTDAELHAKPTGFLVLPAETEWIEFKEAKRSYDYDDLGQCFSALRITTRSWC